MTLDTSMCMHTSCMHSPRLWAQCLFCQSAAVVKFCFVLRGLPHNVAALREPKQRPGGYQTAHVHGQQMPAATCCRWRPRRTLEGSKVSANFKDRPRVPKSEPEHLAAGFLCLPWDAAPQRRHVAEALGTCLPGSTAVALLGCPSSQQAWQSPGGLQDHHALPKI